MTLNKVWVALDTRDRKQAEMWVDQFSECGGFKVGLEAYYSFGSEFIEWLSKRGKKIFLDLKLHDIPNTMAQSAYSVAHLPVDYVTLHLSAGPKALTLCAEAREKSGAKFQWLGVSILTSWAQTDFQNYFKTSEPIELLAEDWISAGLQCGLKHFVCSAADLGHLRTVFPSAQTGAKFVTPGIRMPGDDAGDQVRIVTPKQAFAWGADSLVIGRSLTAAKDPTEALKNLKGHLAL